jgi:hypothetical protein
MEALKWLGKAIDAFKGLRARYARRLVRVKSYVRDLRKLEESSDTAAFSKIEAAALAGVSVTLTQEECVYLNEFKGLWDKYLKTPINKLAELVDDVDDVIDDLEDEVD